MHTDGPWVTCDHMLWGDDFHLNYNCKIVIFSRFAALSVSLTQKVSLFQTTPVGRMISRFAKDIQAVDDNIPMQFDMVVRVIVILVLNFIVIGYITPLFVALVSPIMYLYFRVQRIYKLAALQYKRLDSLSRSPIYNHFSESLGGLQTIRAYAISATSEDKNATIINSNTRAQFTQRMVERWHPGEAVRGTRTHP